MSWLGMDTSNVTAVGASFTRSAFAGVSSKLRFKYLLTLPSQFLARMRAMDELIGYDDFGSYSVESAMHDADHAASVISRSPPPPHTFAPLPGPWGFITSGYAVVLLAMILLLHRIHNIVVPPRQPFPPRHARANQRPTGPRSFFRNFLPVNFSSTRVRLITRLPTLYFLLKSLLAWTVVLAQTSQANIPWDMPVLRTLDDWIIRKEMDALCWSTFCSICGALCVDALTHGLDGSTSNASPFNLFGYAFLLHIYSSPMTHRIKLENASSRPDMHAVFTIILPLLQLAIVHTIGIRRRWSNQRLVPSALVTFLGLTHFHAVLWFSHSSYPLLNYMPRLFETLLVSVTGLALGLNALAQLLAEGCVSRPLFGHREALMPRWEEDVSIALFRLGTASLEASAVSGLGNEVGSVAAFDALDAASSSSVGSSSGLRPFDPARPPSTTGSLEINRYGVMGAVQPGVVVTASSRHHAHAHRRRRPHARKLKGFANEVTRIKAIAPGNSSSSSSGDTDMWGVDSTWYREAGRFGVGATRFAKGLWRLAADVVRRRSVRWRKPPSEEAAEQGVAGAAGRRRGGEAIEDESTGEDWDEEQEGSAWGRAAVEDEWYARFVRNEAFSDEDEDVDFEPPPSASGRSTPSVPSTSSNEELPLEGDWEEGEGEEEEEEADDHNAETVGLYADLSTAATSAYATPTPLLLAHLTNSDTSPLTRRRYAVMSSGLSPSTSSPGAGEDDWESMLAARRRSTARGIGAGSSPTDEARRNCVICTVEQRQIICWPCRCLALCDDCRENLATRTPSSKHSCPCCRQSVEGYSRVYIP